MRLLLVATIALLCGAVFATADDNVLVLTDENFDAEAAKHDMLLVEFYAPWCGHCKRLEPEYAKAAETLAADPSTAHLRIAKCDADSQKKSGGKYGVSGFPTIKLFRFGEVAEEFDGERNADGIVKYVKAKAAVAVNKELTTVKDVKEATADVKGATLVGFFSSKDHLDYRIFKGVVTGLAGAGIDVYHVVSPSVLESFGMLSEGSSIQMFRPGQAASRKKGGRPKGIAYPGTVYKQSLKDWIVENAIAPVGNYNTGNAKLYTLTGDSIVRLLTKDAPAAAAEEVFAPLATTYKGSIRFALSNVNDFAADVEAHCGKGSTQCLLAQEGAKTRRSRVFGMDVAGKFNAATVKAFVDDFVNKKLSVKVKSEAAGPAPKAGEVAVVVGTTFQDLVIDSPKHVLVEFYAPWCGHCKALAPKYDELAAALADKFDDVLIAKVDLTANDLPSEYKDVYHVQGFPTIYFAPKGSKAKPVKFEGSREVDDMKKFVIGRMSA